MPVSLFWASYSRTANVAGSVSAYLSLSANYSGSSYYSLIGYQARGCSVSARDVTSGFALSFQNVGYTGTYLQTVTSVSAMRLLNSPATTTPLIREAPIVYAPGNAAITGTSKQIKGRTRWLYVISQGSALDTFDAKTILCVFAVTTAVPACAIGPYDGSTTPLQ